MIQCVKSQNLWKLLIVVSLLTLSIVAPLLAPVGNCLTCNDVPCQSPCYPGSYAGTWSDCETCWVYGLFHACTACGWQRYQCVPPPCHPPYRWELVVFDNPPPFPVPGVPWYTCRVVSGWLRCR